MAWPVLRENPGIRQKLAIAAALIAYVTVLLWNGTFVVGGADSAGYFSQARLLRHGTMTLPVEPLETMGLDRSWTDVFTIGGFRPFGRALAPTYPIGFPLHIAAASVFGWKVAPFLIMPLAAVGCLLLMAGIGGHLGLRPAASWSAAAILAVFPTFLSASIQPMSDVVATFWAMLAVWLALAGNRGAGVAFAAGVLVRPTNLLLAPVLLLITWPRKRLLVALLLGALPFGAGLLALQWFLYGSPWVTGYGSVGELLSVSHLRQSFPSYARWLFTFGGPLVFPLGLVADARRRPFVCAWALPFLTFYSFYGEHGSWGVSRFVLPAIPALILGGVVLAQRWRFGPVLVALTIAVGAWQTARVGVFAAKQQERIYIDTVRWASPQLPPNALVITGLFSGPFHYFENRFTVNWLPCDGERFQQLRAYAGVAGLRWYALLSDVELPPDEFLRRYPGRWVRAGRYRDITLWRLDE
jgi:hypothetical protein